MGLPNSPSSSETTAAASNPEMDMSPAGHYGLTGMRERADLIGGTLEVTSELGTGTTVHLHVTTPKEAHTRGSQRRNGVLMAAEETIRVLVVEDHHVVRQGLVALLNVVDGIEVIGEAADGVEAITQFRKHQPNVTLIDLRMPRLSGVEVIQRIRMETPHARFIVLTTYDGDEDIYRALQAGARAYLLKGMTTDDLVSTIRAVHAGKSHIPPAVAQRLAERMGTEELTPRNSTSSNKSSTDSATKRSPVSSISPKPPSRPTSTACSVNSGSPIAPRPLPPPFSAESFHSNPSANRNNKVTMKRFPLLALLALILGSSVHAQNSAWRQATNAELASLLPARAPVIKEHIETEMRTASGIVDGRGRYIAGVVLITAGYSAEGKYSHYLVVQSPIKIGGVQLKPGEYVFGYTHSGDVLNVHFNEAATGNLVGTTDAHIMPGNRTVTQLQIWPPSSKAVFQIGRFAIPYELGEK